MERSEVKKKYYFYIIQNNTTYVRFSFALFIAMILAMAGYSCRERGGKYIDQGEIHYNIDYIGSFGGMPKEFLPQNLIVAFKKNKLLFEMTGFGKSGILNLTNPDKGIYDTYFSFFSKKFYYASDAGEVFPGFEAMDGMVLKKTSKTSVICGFNCKNIEVTFPSDEKLRYDIWYTNEINVKNPNASTPFSSVDGILMNFIFRMGAAELHFSVETVYKKDIADETFERREDYRRVSKSQINKFINEMINM
jgi:hypothetical protein